MKAVEVPAQQIAPGVTAEGVASDQQDIAQHVGVHAYDPGPVHRYDPPGGVRSTLVLLLGLHPLGAECSDIRPFRRGRPGASYGLVLVDLPV